MRTPALVAAGACIALALAAGQVRAQAAGPAQPEERAVRDVTPPGVIPAPSGKGPLVRIPGVVPPPAPERWRRFFRPTVIAAGMLDLGSRRVRLAGIVPTPPERMCDGPEGAWPCGRLALTATRQFVRARAVECRFAADAADDPVVAPCRIGPVDLALYLVGQGWAVPADDAAETLTEAAGAARCAGSGLWRGAPADPACPVSAPPPPAP